MRAFRKTPILAVLVLAISLTSLPALEIDQGRVRLVLHEGIGRFSLYARSGYTQDTEIPLFVDQDPRTSGISLVVNDKIYKLGDAPDFHEKIEKATISGIPRFEWESRTLKVVQEFSLVSSPTSTEAEGVRMSIQITNLSRSKLSVGLRMCFDTYLGEESLSHFRSDRHQDIRNELTVSSADMIRYWLSPSSKSPQEIGLMCITSGADITSPDKIVFANWKRLSDSSWDYKTSSNRNFNLMPYSINDSAVCMYYDPVAITAQGSREIVLVLANLTLSDYGLERQVAASAPTPSEPPVDSLQALGDRVRADVGAGEDDTAAIQRELDNLNALLEEIERRLSSEEDISDQDFRLMEEILSAIKDKTERYSGAQ
jgi:hypothetical protein